MAVNGKNKGNTFERKVAKLMSDRFTVITGKTMSFRRNADSGSFFGGFNQRRTETHDLSKAEFGDVITPPNFKYSLECKHYKIAPSFSMMLEQDCKMLDEWIAKVEQDAKNSNRLPCIIMKFNNVKESVMVKELIDGVKPSMFYKDYYVLPLKDFLVQPDDYFFTT